MTDETVDPALIERAREFLRTDGCWPDDEVALLADDNVLACIEEEVKEGKRMEARELIKAGLAAQLDYLVGVIPGDPGLATCDNCGGIPVTILTDSGRFCDLNCRSAYELT